MSTMPRLWSYWHRHLCSFRPFQYSSFGPYEIVELIGTQTNKLELFEEAKCIMFSTLITHGFRP
uniref:Uncharacterized protein n=1 Tax=Arundo donax TaxID=35708 RepID=A0A0A9B5A5_ARUDO